jgi:hypothetical protein
MEFIGHVSSKEARLHASEGKRIKCAMCGRDAFDRPSPHNCQGGFRKRHLRWLLLDERRLSKDPIAPLLAQIAEAQRVTSIWAKITRSD